MTKNLPPNLLALFGPRPPLEYKPPPDRLSIDRKPIKITGIAEYVDLFEDPKDTPAKVHIETRQEIRKRKRKAKKELNACKIEAGIAKWKPHENSKATHKPYKTLFVGRLAYETTKSTLKRKFDRYGRIKDIVIVGDLNGKSRGYAFIEYRHASDMADAYKHANEMRIDGRRVVVDYERGRTVKTWLPRKFGGGKGGRSRSTR